MESTDITFPILACLGQYSQDIVSIINLNFSINPNDDHQNHVFIYFSFKL